MPSVIRADKGGMRVTLAGWMFGGWACAAVLAGSVLMSFHQPFRTPGEGIMSLGHAPDGGSWRMLHVVSGSCGCSQKVMDHLLQRGPVAGVQEEVLVVDGGEPYLTGSAARLEKLAKAGFVVSHVKASAIPADAGLKGVPLLAVASPGRGAVYVGGYGSGGDQDGTILRELMAGRKASPLAAIGCAVGLRIRRAADPLRLKYQGSVERVETRVPAAKADAEEVGGEAEGVLQGLKPG